jgi:hypothetical protein
VEVSSIHYYTVGLVSRKSDVFNNSGSSFSRPFYHAIKLIYAINIHAKNTLLMKVTGYELRDTSFISINVSTFLGRKPNKQVWKCAC